MTFGQTLKHLMSVSGIKTSQLSKELSYDTSYVSRWVNDVKIPSPKNIENLFENISSIIVSNCDENAMRDLLIAYAADNEHELHERITHALSLSYQEMLPETKQNVPASGVTYVNDEFFIDSTEKFIDAVILCSKSKPDGPVNFFTSYSIGTYNIFNNKRDSGFWKTIAKHPYIKSNVSLISHQLIDIREFEMNIDSYCAALLYYANMDMNLQYRFYLYDPSSDVPTAYFTMVEDQFLTYSFQSSLSQSEIQIIITEKTF